MEREKSKKLLLISLMIIIILFDYSAVVYGQTGIHLSSPWDNQAVQGIQSIQGTAAGDDFLSYIVQFSTTISPEDWFVIYENNVQVTNGILAEWDTTIISDGEYHLRLVVMFESGDLIVKNVSNIRVRNYTLIETATPTISPTINNTITVTPTISSTKNLTVPTSFPENPAIFTDYDIFQALKIGALVALFILLPVVFYQFIKQNKRY